MTDVRPPFRQAVRLALQDHISRQNLERVLSSLERRVRHALENEEAHQDILHARRVREETLRNLPALLKRLQGSAQRRGFRVCSVDTPAEAIACFLDVLAHRDPVATVSQGILEEVGAYHALREDGYQLLDIQLGTYFLHLIEDESAHPVVPLAHLSLMDIAMGWSETTGHAIRPSAEALIAAIGGRIRAHISHARSALVPAAFAVADTGTVVILDDEGTLVPTLHHVDTLVLVLAIHRIVPTLSDLPPLIHVTARGSRGTSTFAHTLFLHAPPRGSSQTVHLVLVDNERGRLHEEGVDEPLRCLECSACATVCPAFREVGGQVYGTPYMGPIGHILPPLLWPDRYADLAFGTPMCGTANTVCPVGLDFPALIARARYHVRAREGVPWRIRAFLTTWRRGVYSPLGRFFARLGTEMILAPARAHGLSSARPTTPVHPPPRPASPPSIDRLTSLFAERGWGIDVEDNFIAARLTVLSYLQEHHVTHVVGWSPEMLGMEGLPEALQDVGIQWHHAVDYPSLEGPFVGLVRAEAVITKTGTVVIRSSEETPMSSMFRTDTLLVIVESNRVVSTWEDVLPLLAPQATMVLFSENARTFALDGVPHPMPLGPKRLHLVIVQTRERDISAPQVRRAGE